MEPLDLDREHLRQLSKAPPTTVRRPPAQLTNTALPNSELQREKKSSSNVHRTAVCVSVYVHVCLYLSRWWWSWCDPEDWMIFLTNQEEMMMAVKPAEKWQKSRAWHICDCSSFRQFILLLFKWLQMVQRDYGPLHITLSVLAAETGWNHKAEISLVGPKTTRKTQFNNLIKRM